MATLPKERTKPKPLWKKEEKPDAQYLVAGRYGTKEMVNLFGAEKTMEYTLLVQGISAQVLSNLYPDVVPAEDAKVLVETATLKYVKPARIREIEEAGGHDVIAINTAWEEVVKTVRASAAPHINKIKTSADSTESAKAIQLKAGLEVLADSAENLRDVVLEKALEWADVRFMEVTHLYDALPSVAGRAFAHYAETLQSGLNMIKYAHDNSVMAKWADVTGNYHSAADMKLDGPAIEEEFCKRLNVKHMIAPAQTPAREYLEDIYYAVTRLAKTTGRLGHYVRWGRSSDVGVFKFPTNLGKKGSSGMPHKDMMGGNPDKEEQAESIDHVLAGVLCGSLEALSMDYARDLTGSALDRIFLDIAFKCTDCSVRNMAGVMDKLKIDPVRSVERIGRTYGTITSPRVLAYVTDRRNGEPMARSEAHDEIGKCATQAYEQKQPFAEVLKGNKIIGARIPGSIIDELTNPLNYIGESKGVINKAYDAFHGKKTF